MNAWYRSAPGIDLYQFQSDTRHAAFHAFCGDMFIGTVISVPARCRDWDRGVLGSSAGAPSVPPPGWEGMSGVTPAFSQAFFAFSIRLHAAGDYFGHVAVLVGNGQFHRILSPIFHSCFFLYSAESFFRSSNFSASWSRDDIAQFRKPCIPFHIRQMIKAVVALRVPRGVSWAGSRALISMATRGCIYHDIFG